MHRQPISEIATKTQNAFQCVKHTSMVNSIQVEWSKTRIHVYTFTFFTHAHHKDSYIHILPDCSTQMGEFWNTHTHRDICPTWLWHTDWGNFGPQAISRTLQHFCSNQAVPFKTWICHLWAHWEMTIDSCLCLRCPFSFVDSHGRGTSFWAHCKHTY